MDGAALKAAAMANPLTLETIMHIMVNAANAANDDLRPEPIAYVSTVRLALLADRQHSMVAACADRASKRLGLGPLRQRPVLNSKNRPMKTRLVPVEVVAEMTAGAALAGQHGTAAVYRGVAAEMRAGELMPIEGTVMPSGRVAPPRNEREADHSRKTADRRAKLVGVMPTPSVYRGRTVLSHREVAGFAGISAFPMLRSVRRLLDAKPEIIARAVFAVKLTAMVGRQQTAERMFDGYLLTAEAIDALADQFELCRNAIGRARSGPLRVLARGLREGTA